MRHDKTHRDRFNVEAVGIEPTSESLWRKDPTCVARVLMTPPQLPRTEYAMA